jgi:formylglycine-generating enzyme required for sulfatase activity
MAMSGNGVKMFMINISNMFNVRGGGWFDYVHFLRSAQRYTDSSGTGGFTLGFRLIRRKL